MNRGSLLACQISDLHVKAPGRLSYGVVDCAAMLARCVVGILRLPQRPDLVLATGDLTDSGRAEEYAHLRELLAPLPMPVHFIPGNHDERGALRAAFPEHAYLRQWDPYVQYAIDDWPLRIIAIDTVIPGEDGGRLDDERLAWLEKTLSLRRDKPTLLIMHHPPLPHAHRPHGPDRPVGKRRARARDRAPSAGGARAVRPSAPADPVPLRRDDRLDLPEPGAPGGARPRPRRRVGLQDGAAGVPAACLEEGRRRRQPYCVHR